jgi:putative hydrolase of the HAD superfamily
MQALLLDYGGVLTTNVFEGFATFCTSEGLPSEAVGETLRQDDVTLAMLAELEIGSLSPRDFEVDLARRVSTRFGVEVSADRLLRRMMAHIVPDESMLAATMRFRAAGAITVLLSNSMGRRGYPWERLDPLFHHVVLSGQVGMRKPDPGIYLYAAAQAGVAPEACVLVDDAEVNVGAKSVGMEAIHHVDAASTIERLETRFGS